MTTLLNKTYLLLAVLLNMTAAGTAVAAAVSVTASVDRSEITVGDPIRFTAEIRRQKQVVLDLPGLNVALGGFDIRDYASDDVTDAENGDITTRIRYVITTYATGDYMVPPLQVAYFDSVSNDTGVIATDSIAITVKSVAASEAEDILDIKPPAVIRGSRTLIYSVAILAVLFIAGFLFYFFYLRKRWGGAGALFASKEVPPVPPHTEALAALDELDAEALIAAGRVREHYFRVSEILRRYQGRRYGCPVLERTTAEIDADMAALDVPENERTLFSGFHRDCDLVKFASVMPGEDDAAGLTGRAREIISLTMVPEPEPVTGERTVPAMLAENDTEQAAPVDTYDTDDDAASPAEELSAPDPEAKE